VPESHLRPAPASVELPSPLGPMEATARNGRLVGLRFCWDRPARHVGADPVLDELAAWLARYWAGDHTTGTVPLDWEGVSAFRRDVLEATAAVPHGQVTTYGRLAAAVGRPGQARAVGSALRSNPWVLLVPCHRVVAADGALTGYAGGPTTGGHLDVKAALLDHERPDRQLSLFTSPA